jgi:hypothetical protein
MATYIINLKTGRYFQSPDQWAEKREEATDFESGSRAISLAFEKNLRDVELLLAFELPAHREIRMPLRHP